MADDRIPTSESRAPTADDRVPTSESRAPTADDRTPTSKTVSPLLTDDPSLSPAPREPSTDDAKPAPKPSRLRRLATRVRRRPIRFAILASAVALLVYSVIAYISLPTVATLKELVKTRPKTTALMELRKTQAAANGKTLKIRSSWLPLSSISEHLTHAVITTEDASFFQHDGIDWEELQISVKRDLEEGDRLRGASTITQQLAKNLYLDPSRSVFRKLREMVIAHRMEQALSKPRILELYLNLIEWGNGVFGCELAAQNAFGKSCSDLDREEAARLAAIIASPLKHRANGDDRFVTRRTAMILNRMEARGW